MKLKSTVFISPTWFIPNENNEIAKREKQVSIISLTIYTSYVLNIYYIFIF